MKQPLYFNLSLFNQQYDLAVEALADAMANSGSAKGEICFNEYPSMKVKYNLETAKITLEPTEGISPYVISVFPAKNFPFIVSPVSDAITLCAKRKLLDSLNALGEDSIAAVIAKHAKKGNEISFSRSAANKALVSLRESSQFSFMRRILGGGQTKVSEAFLALSRVLKSFSLEQINSYSVVDDVMNTFNQNKSAKKRGKLITPKH